MNQFEVSAAGRVRETAVREIVEKLKALFPDMDASAYEAGHMVGRAYSSMEEMRTTYWTSFGVTGPRFSVLRLLYTAEGKRLSMGEIAAGISKGTPNITQLIDGLEREGLVRRVVGEADKRVIYATLTPEGENLFAAIFPQNMQRVREVWAPLNEEERALLIHLLAKLRMNLSTNQVVGNAALPAADASLPGADHSRRKPATGTRANRRQPEATQA